MEMIPSVHPGVLTLLLLSLPTILRVIFDYIRIEKKHLAFTDTTYIQRNIWTGLTIILVSAINHLIFHHPHGVGPYAPYLTQVAASYGTFILLFDYALNLSRGKSIIYTSTNPAHPSGFEQMSRITPWYGTLFIKIVLAMAGWGSYIYFEML